MNPRGWHAHFLCVFRVIAFLGALVIPQFVSSQSTPDMEPFVNWINENETPWGSRTEFMTASALQSAFFLGSESDPPDGNLGVTKDDGRLFLQVVQAHLTPAMTQAYLVFLNIPALPPPVGGMVDDKRSQCPSPGRCSLVRALWWRCSGALCARS
jgi:hypothetical protein